MQAVHLLIIELNRQRIEAAEDTGFRCTSWQWEQSVGVQFWNKHFSRFGEGTVLRGEDYRNHIKAQPTEVQSTKFVCLPICFGILWLTSLGLTLVSMKTRFALHCINVGFMAIFWLCCSRVEVCHAVFIRLKVWIKLILYFASQLNILIDYIPIHVLESSDELSQNKRDLYSGYLSLHSIFTFYFSMCIVLVFCSIPNTPNPGNQDDELILLSGYCNVALPQVAQRFPTFKTKLLLAVNHYTPTTKRGRLCKQILRSE